MKKWLVLGFILALIVVGNDMFAQGCSQCKMLTEQGSELSEGSFGTNINWGILYLMIIPYLLIMFLFRKRIFDFFRSLVKK
ncbi:MAG: hypothetical protein RLZ33_2945 [Bacteroidota bacterium]|jgi:hypothetical protein